MSKELFVVTLEAPIDMWEHREMRDLFCDALGMKVGGYEFGYKGESRVLPIDGSDFIGIHELVCHRVDGKIVPLMCYRSISKSHSDQYGLTFPFLSGVRASNSKFHIEVVEKLLEEWQGKSIWYDSALTIAPDVRGDVELELTLHKILYGLVLHHRRYYGADRTFMLANRAFNTDKTFKKMGSTILAYEDKEVPSLYLPYSGNNEHKIIICENNFSMKTLRFAKEFLPLWENRIVFSPEKEQKIAA